VLKRLCVSLIWLFYQIDFEKNAITETFFVLFHSVSGKNLWNWSGLWQLYEVMKSHDVRTKCHWRAQLLAHALSQTHLLRLGSYFFFSWVFLYYCSTPKNAYIELKRLQWKHSVVIIALPNAISQIFCVLSGTIFLWLGLFECLRNWYGEYQVNIRYVITYLHTCQHFLCVAYVLNMPHFTTW